MTDNQKRILEMLAEKKISVDEAERLLAAMGQPEGSESEISDSGVVRKAPPKYLRVLVTPPAGQNSGTKGEVVNVRVPLALIRSGIKLSALLPPDKAEQVNDALRSKGINFDVRNVKPEDIEQLIEALRDLEVDISDEKGGKVVRVYVE